MEAVQSHRSHRDRAAWVLVGLVTLLLVIAGVTLWWRGRAVTAQGVNKALESQPETFADLTAHLGWMAQSDYYATMPQDSAAMVKAFSDHPELSHRVLWYEDRGGRVAVTQVQFIDGLLNAWDHQQFVAGGKDAEGLPVRSFCVYLDARGRIVGWADVTGAPAMLDLLKWAMASGPGKHPEAKSPE